MRDIDSQQDWKLAELKFSTVAKTDRGSAQTMSNHQAFPRKPIPYGRQEITDLDIDAVVRVLKSDYLTQGPEIERFENAFAQYVGARYAVAVSNGTAALHLSALALGVAAGTRVITTPITFAASANCVAYCGGSVEFVDVDPATALIDIGRVEELILSKPEGTFQGIIPVDFAGAPVNLEQLKSVADRHGLWILEDACHAPGGFFTAESGQEQRCGNGRYADLSIFSFHPVKHIACGEGGMVTTNRTDLYRKLLLLRTHGITRDPELLQQDDGGWYYEMQVLGYNYRMTDIQAALGLSQLGRADENLARRREIARVYDQAFQDTPLVRLSADRANGHAYHLYVVRVPNRKRIFDELWAQGIHAQIHYIPVPKLPYYKALGFDSANYPAAEAYYQECLSLPMFPSLSDQDLDHVIREVKKLLDGSSFE